MSSPKIALFANHDNKQLHALREILEDMGANPQMFDIRPGGPTEPKITMQGGRMYWAGVDFSDIHAVHIRCTAINTLPVLPPLLNATTYTQYMHVFQKEQLYQTAAYNFFDRLSAQGKLVINPLTSAYVDHDSKSQLYEKLRAAGFDTPITRTTNDEAEVIDFINSHKEALVKPAIGFGNARSISLDDKERFNELRVFPLVMQERVFGDTIRVHIVGDTVVLALKIINKGDVDSRIGTDGFEYFKLPPEEEEKIVRANRMLGLHYAAWDVIFSPEGRVAYLDCNPGPYIMWIGDDNVKTVLTELARYMVVYSQTHSMEEASASIQAA